MKIFEKTKSIVKSTVMCIRYPFLYPRNRFTGLHYNNWELHQYHVENYKKAVKYICMHTYKEDEVDADKIKALVTDVKLNNILTYGYHIRNGIIILYYKDRIIKKISIDQLGNGTIIAMGFRVNGDNVDFDIIFDNDSKLSDEHRFHIFNYVVDRILYYKVRIADFLNDYVLQLFHCIPTYTEWDALEHGYPGWYKAFGKQLLKDIDKQLRKDKIRRKWRITDIKEKWGELRIYCNYGSSDLYKLIEKYSELSFKTCIECGKPAKYLTGGWICPYCEEHFDSVYKPYAIMGNDGNWEYDDEQRF